MQQTHFQRLIKLLYFYICISRPYVFVAGFVGFTQWISIHDMYYMYWYTKTIKNIKLTLNQGNPPLNNLYIILYYLDNEMTMKGLQQEFLILGYTIFKWNDKDRLTTRDIISRRHRLWMKWNDNKRLATRVSKLSETPLINEKLMNMVMTILVISVFLQFIFFSINETL